MSLTCGIVSGERRLSPAELGERVRRVAGGLRRLGVSQGDSVAILMRNDVAFLEVSYAAMMLGAYAVPINWHLKAEEVAYVLEDSASKVLVGHADLLAPLRDAVPGGVLILSAATPPEVVSAYAIAPPARQSRHGTPDYEAWLGEAAPYEGPSLPAPQSMIYTSGTTGRPKGVRRNAPTAAQDEALNRMRARVYGLEPGIRTAIPGPLYHSAPNAFGLRAGRIAEALFLLPRFDPEGLLRLIESERIDTMFMVPTMFIRLLKLDPQVRASYDMSSLRHIIHAAAPCPADVKARMIAWWGPVLFEFYGGTKSGAVSFATSADALAKPGTVGRASPGAELRIFDDDGRELPRGAVGEIYSRLVAYPDFTYHHAPDKRAEVERDGFITCGDVGYIDDDGYLFICDRKRDMVISGGVNIYPAEIEAMLHGAPHVHDCAVFGIPNAEFGEELMAVVEPRPGEEVSVDAVRAYLVARLAAYKVPRTIEVRHDLPREDSGKLFKRRLRDPYWEGAGRRV